MNDAIALYMNYARIVKNRRLSFFFFFFSNAHVSSVLPSCNMTTVPVRRVKERERKRERRREREKEKTEKGSAHRTDTWTDETSVRVHAFFRSFSFYFMHTHERELSLLKHRNRGVRWISVNITKSKKTQRIQLVKKQQENKKSTHRSAEMRKEGMHNTYPRFFQRKRKKYDRQWSSSITLFVCCLLSSNISLRARSREKKRRMCFFLLLFAFYLY